MLRIEVIGYLEPGADEAEATVLADGVALGSVTIPLSEIDHDGIDHDGTVGVIVVDPGRGWEGQRDEWRANRDEWATAASPAAAALIREFHDRGERTRYVS